MEAQAKPRMTERPVPAVGRPPLRDVLPWYILVATLKVPDAATQIRDAAPVKKEV
jgi:hypothetical protein